MRSYSEVSFRCLAWSLGLSVIAWLVIAVAIWGLTHG